MNIEFSKDKNRMDIKLIHHFLNDESYWGKGRSLSEITNAVSNSLCFGIFFQNHQIGFARVVTDFIFFAYLMDVFILKEFRGNGFGKSLISHILEDQELKNVKKWMLATTDAHLLYAKFGFKKIENPNIYMELKK